MDTAFLPVTLSRTHNCGEEQKNQQRGLGVAQAISLSVKFECHGSNFSAECVPLCVCGKNGGGGGGLCFYFDC